MPELGLGVSNLAKDWDAAIASHPAPGAAKLTESRKAHRLGEPAPSVGFKRPLSAPGVAERFLWFLVLRWPSLGSHHVPLRLCHSDYL